MKPPWKFLAQLMSRQRPSEQPDPARERDIDRKPVEIELQSPSGPSLASPQADLGEEHARESQSPDPVEALAANPPEVDALVPAASAIAGKGQGARAIDEREQVVTDVTGLAAGKGPVKPSGIAQGRPSRIARKAHVNRTAKNTATAGEAPVPQSHSVSENPLFDEAASLDEDIQQLRDQLAQKLRSQNDQLRKMLERFERS